MDELIKLWRRPVGVMLAVLLVFFFVPIPAPAEGEVIALAEPRDGESGSGSVNSSAGSQTTGLQADGLKWTADVSVTDNDGHNIEALPAGGDVRVHFSLGLDNSEASSGVLFTEGSPLLQETFTFYINSALIDVTSTVPAFSNPVIAPSAVPMFSDSSLAPASSGETLDGSDQTFYKYEIKFNTAPEAVSAWNNYAGLRAEAIIAMKIVDKVTVPPGVKFIHVDYTSGQNDIDLTYIPPEQIPPPTNAALLIKEQVTEPQEAEQVFESVVPTELRNVPGADFYGYSPAGSDVITSEKSYAVFRIRINEHGLAKLHTNSITGEISPAAFKEMIPEGMKIISKELSPNTYYGVKLSRTYGNPNKTYTDASGRTLSYIDYADPRTKTVNVVFRGSKGTNDNIYGMEALKGNSLLGDADDASNFGLTSSFSADSLHGTAGEDVLNISFGKAPPEQPDINYFDNVEYTLYIIMIPTDIPAEPTELTNRVTLDYPEITDEQNASSTFYLSNSAGSAGIKKFALGTGGWLPDEYVVALPGTDGTIEQSYRIIVPSISNTSFAAESIRFSDYGDERYIDLTDFKTSDVAINAYNGIPGQTGEVGELTTTTAVMEVKELVPVDVSSGTVTKTGFRAENTSEIPAGSLFHTLDYTYKYTGVPYGAAVRNTAFRSVYTVTPLRFDLDKFDIDDADKLLTGWAFGAFYAQAGDATLPDTARPVLDITGTAAAFTSASDTAYIIPEGYSPRASGEWHIVFVETKQPDGYPAANIGLQVPAVIRSTDEGTLSVAALEGDTGAGAGGAKASYVTFSGVMGVATVTAYNKSGGGDDPPDGSNPPGGDPPGGSNPPGGDPLGGGDPPGGVSPPAVADPPADDLPGGGLKNPNEPGLTPSGGTGIELPTLTPSGETGEDIEELSDDDVPLTSPESDETGGDETSDLPKTGDDTMTGVLFALMIAAIIALLIVRRELQKYK
ncbi:MAG: LPXTG cell wall anchor domain-containing protein [Clostridiales Family XIII bacterium]|jgi:LPXTG-motif cell wall-anchored protein|nr:LPXTG cell wall anchor domain-containing protein [Clostridiales Family XIII bacterium]